MAIICQGCASELATWMGHCPKCGWTSRVEVRERQDSLIGQVVGGRYKVVRKLGQGGMGTVYLAEHTGVGQQVAIKFLSPTLSGDPDVVRRFLNEAKSYAQITHPHAVQLHDFGQDDDGNLYISMEYIEGQDLKRTLEQVKRFSLKDALDVGLQICEVLGYAHDKGIVHRDLKPENIMLVKGMRGFHAKVLDFGVARLMAEQTTRVTVTGSITGTPRYMSPEQAEGKEVDHRTDIYALGLVLYECVIGAHPFGSATIAETLRRQVVEPVPHLSFVRPDLRLPEALDDAIQKAVAKKREERFGSMGEFAKALVTLVPTATLRAHVPDGDPDVTAPAGAREKTAHERSPYDREDPSRSRGGLIALVSAAAVIALGAGGYLLLWRPDVSRAADAGSSPMADSLPKGTGPEIAPTPPPDRPITAATGSGAPAQKAPDGDARAGEELGAGKATARADPPNPDRPAVAASPLPARNPAGTPRPALATQVASAIETTAVGNIAVRDIHNATFTQAVAKFDGGDLAAAAAQLRILLGSASVTADLREKIVGLQQRIGLLQQKLRQADDSFQKGQVGEAARLYREVKDLNPHIRDAVEGLARCKAEKPPEKID